MVQLISAVQSHGLDSEAFKKAHDLALTGLMLEPVAELALPPHLTFARHAFDVRGVESLTRFGEYVSSVDLKTRGIVDVAAEQVS